MKRTNTAEPSAPIPFPTQGRPARRAVIGHTRPDVAEVVKELMKKSHEFNTALAKRLRKGAHNA